MKKKYIITYSILFLILLGLGLTHGIPFGVTVSEDACIHSFIPKIIRNIMLIYNIIIMLACFVMAVILTNQKENVLKCKWMIPVIMFICFALLPVGMREYEYIQPPGHTKEFVSFISLIMHNLDMESEYQLSEEKEDMIPMVMVNDVIYLYTGHDRETVERRDTFDGEITSEVDGSKKPTVNDQSNFGTGYVYQYGPIEGMLDIYMNDNWQVFATEKIIASDTLIIDGQLGDMEESDKIWDRIPMVRVNGKLYYDTGRESTVNMRCGNMDGEITSTVDGTGVPMEDNQSNFGSGFGYQYGADDTIEIYMNERWVVFEYREESE